MSAPSPSPSTPPLPPPPNSGGKVAAAAGGGGLLVYLIDKMLADQGALAGSMLERLGPVVSPALANWPTVAVLVGVTWWASGRWREAQASRAAEAATLATSVAAVADNLDGLRTEVVDLRRDLREHVDSVDARLRSADASMRDYVRGEISPLVERVAALEKRRTRATRARDSKDRENSK